ncbi:MAG: hypothetical protein JXR94_12375, partial [Candidatus Hydrogenedentes bacterium]|nr:hypothetical protein [Candidatus Hydrogenedentota bacterium]
GVIESPPFTLDAPGYILLVGGGNDPENVYVAIVDADSGEELARYTGTFVNPVRAVPFDASGHAGKKAFIRVVDRATEGWGHINFGGIFERPEPRLLD